jgi:hypothetical protein
MAQKTITHEGKKYKFVETSTHIEFCCDCPHCGTFIGEMGDEPIVKCEECGKEFYADNDTTRG